MGEHMTQSTGKVPRGFTRYYVLYLLSEKELTGKDIINESIRRSDGYWAPSPGLIYPLLGRLVRDGLVAELDEGKYTITEAGLKELREKSDFQNKLETQLALINKLGLFMFAAGKFIADETIEHMKRVSTTLWDRLKNLPPHMQRSFEVKYEQFLLEELEKLNHRKTRKTPVSGAESSPEQR